MKKYTYIAFTTTLALSTTCMELQLEERHNIQSSSSIALPANSKLYSFNTLNALVQPQLQTAHVVQKKYTDLDFVPVYVYTNPNEIELTPVYKPIDGSKTEYLDCITNTKKTIPEQKPLLQTNSLTQSDNYLINRLYNSACDFSDYIKSKKSDVIIQNKKLTTIIHLMNIAKHNSITEDFMSKFAYEKDHSQPISFIFSCLKRYMLTSNNTEEKQPF